MRHALAVAAISLLLALGLELVTTGRPSPPKVELLGIAAPQQLVPGEHAAVFGGLSVPKGSYEIGLWTCSSGDCRRTSWIRIEGPGTFWRWLGSEDAPSGQGRIVLRVYDVGSPFGGLVGEWSQRVSAE